jgi:hypothetical protein
MHLIYARRKFIIDSLMNEIKGDEMQRVRPCMRIIKGVTREMVRILLG